MYKYCFQNFPVAGTKEKKSKTKLAKIFEKKIAKNKIFVIKMI